jgi:hypothetical protein
MGRVETYLHLAAQGLTLEEPSPMGDIPEPEAPPVVEVTRRAQGGQTSVADALLFWIDRVLGA